MSKSAGFRDPKILFAFLLITLIWSSTWIVIKDQIGSATVSPAWSVTYRYVVAASAMFFYAWMTGAALRLNASGHLLAACFGVPQFCFNFNLVYYAEHYVTSGLVATVFALLMVPNSALAWIFLRQRVSAGFIAGSAIACVGVSLLFVQEMRASAVAPYEIAVGIGLTLLAVLSASAANIIQATRRAADWPLPTLLAWGMLYGNFANLVFALAVAGPPQGDLRPGYWLGLVYLGLFASALAFPLYFAVMRAVGAGRAAYSSLLVPILAMAISTAVEGYVWSPLAIAGGVVALLGMAVALWAKRPAPAVAET